jgi:hypothetical protein
MKSRDNNQTESQPRVDIRLIQMQSDGRAEKKKLKVLKQNKQTHIERRR